MKKIGINLMLLCALFAFGAYNVGDTVSPADNLGWIITGPNGHPDVGTSSDVFTKISENKAVFLFMGQLW